MAIFYRKDVWAIWEREGLSKLTAEQKDRLEKISGWELACVQTSKLAGYPIKTKAQLTKFWMIRLMRFVSHTVRVGWDLIKYSLQQPAADVLQFLTGIPEGFKCFLNTDANFAKTGRRTEVYFVLLAYWPEIEEMRQENPPVTRKYLLTWLEKEEGKQLVESDQIFNAICDAISLAMSPPGHPFKRSES